MSYPVVKLLDYRGRWEELEGSPNPFSVVVMAHLKSQETRGRDRERFNWKLRLTRMLYERGYGRDEILGLYRFIDMVVRLPEEMEEEYHEEIIREEEVKGMEYITTAERIGMRKGLEQGMLEDAREMVLGIGDRDTLKRLHRLAIRCDSLEEFRRELARCMA